MGNMPSSQQESSNNPYKSFPGSILLEKTLCGSIDTTDPSEYEVDSSTLTRLVKRAEILCISSPTADDMEKRFNFHDDDDDSDSDDSAIDAGDGKGGRRQQRKSTSPKQTSRLFARALVSEASTNMKTQEMAQREKKLLKAQQAAVNAASSQKKRSRGGGGSTTTPSPTLSSPQGNAGSGAGHRAVGASGRPHILRSVALACAGGDVLDGEDTSALGATSDHNNHLSGLLNCIDGAAATSSPRNFDNAQQRMPPVSPHSVTIGVSLSRRHAHVGHPGTITRQTAYDFNQVQDRDYKYISATQDGWKAGGGENTQTNVCPDTIHIPIIHLDCPNSNAVDAVIGALASGEIFIPHICLLPEALATTGSSPPDLVVKFGCERNDDLNVDDWPNWCLEFMHNQIYEYFSDFALWMPRSFQITLAHKVRWKTVKHMNHYFANAETVLKSWRDMGPQYMLPISPQFDGGASAEEVARPHGIYLFRQGVPTNYFPPNFEPPYTTKMTRALLMNVLEKSWDKKKRIWSSTPLPRLVAPTTLLANACGCGDATSHPGYMAREATTVVTRESMRPHHHDQDHHHPHQHHRQQQQQHNHHRHPRDDKNVHHNHNPPAFGYDNDDTTDVLSEVEFGNTNVDEPQPPAAAAASDRYSKSSAAPQRPNADAFSDEDSDDDDDDEEDAENVKLPQQQKQHIRAPSMAGSGTTTIVHANKQTLKSPTKHQKKKQLYSDEDFMNTNKPSSPTSPHYTMEPSFSGSPTKSQRRSSDNSKPAVEHVASLEYSTDGSSAYFNQEPSLIGQDYLNAKSNEESQLSRKSNKAKQHPTLRLGGDNDDETDVTEDDDELLSLQESSSSMSIVPTDEELYAAGWAKALDPNSGNHYYFTLDRTRTVWENPLVSRGMVDP